jgi:hypothetical protein
VTTVTTSVSVFEVVPRGRITLQEVPSRGRGRTALALLGPPFVASVAYVDPGNFATNFAGGAEHGYQLVWVVVMANLLAILIQYLTSKAGLATGQSLPELCRQRYGRRHPASYSTLPGGSRSSAEHRAGSANDSSKFSSKPVRPSSLLLAAVSGCRSWPRPTIE